MDQRSRADRGPLEGEVAIVTGGGRGVGRAIAEELSVAGASVAVSARTRSEIEAVAAEIVARGGHAVAVTADVTDEGAVGRLLSAVGEELGPPTLLVNNAGAWGAVGPVEESDVEVWWNDVEVSLKGTYLCTRAVLPSMIAQRRGRIVNLASRAGTVARPYASGYAAGKAAVLSFTQSVAAEVEARGIEVFAVSPGFVRTALIDGVVASPGGRAFMSQLADRDDDLRPELAARLVVDIASGRLDALSGCFLHVLDDLEALLAAARLSEAAGAG
jgi:NAD(P)-dependent dehydrogenase (short-subunit alcohol dehydrogenase family)